MISRFHVSVSVYIEFRFLITVLEICFFQQENYKKQNYVQISAETYTHLTGLENQVKTYHEQFQTLESQVKTYEEQFQTLENQIEELNEKLSQAWSEVETKEKLVKQHAKVAEDAVLGICSEAKYKFNFWFG